MAKLLIVEDDLDVAEMLAAYLRSLDYSLAEAHDGQTAIDILRSDDFDAVILDLGLPKIGGLDVLRDLRSRGSKTPVLILTGKDTVQEKEAGLDAGADDYVTKPCDLRELSARIKALLRRPFKQSK